MNRLVLKFVALVIAGIVAACASASAQRPAPAGEFAASADAFGSANESPLAFSRADVFSTIESDQLVRSLAMIDLLDGRRFPVPSSLGRMGMARVDFSPLSMLTQTAVPRGKQTRTSEMDVSDDATARLDLRNDSVYAGGEVGVFYGRSTGKYGAEQFGSYIIGTVGNDKVQITAGASYQESTFNFRGRR